MRLFFSGMTDSPQGRQIIAQALTDLIRLSGMPVDDVAKASGVTRQHIYRAMSGKGNLTIDLIDKIFEACGSNFGAWLSQRASHRGKDRICHERLQHILDAGGQYAITAKTSIDAWFSALSEKSSKRP